MALGPGVLLGPYEITAPLGAGGMGEVYRAHDQRLRRDVAVKVLKTAGRADPERQARFEAEARAMSAVSHPGLLAIFDVGSHEGSPYLVTELLEGQTLRERMQAGPFSQRKLQEVARQLAQALAAAHERGVVHRDLKPENVFTTRDGRVKILDFGLARLVEEEPASPEAETSGRVFGTAGYIAPEQVRGDPVDGRADLFALGAILYEMASGRRAFQGPTAVETMNAVLNEEPPALAQVCPDLSPGLARLIERCLEKVAAERFQSARDLGFALESLDTTTSTSRALPRLASPRGPRRGQVLALLLGLALGALLGWALLPRVTPGVPELQRLTFRRGTIEGARFSPDGQTFVYGADWDGAPVELFQGRLGSPESRPLGLRDADVLAVSGSGEMLVSLGRRRVGTFVATGTLARVPLAGGAPREVMEDVQEADWSPAGEIAVVRAVAGRVRLEHPVGQVLFETAGWVSHPRFSPDGARIAFVDHPVWGDDGGNLAVVDLKARVQVLSRGWGSLMGLAWSPRGNEIWFTGTRDGASRALHAVDLAGRERALLRMAAALTLHDVQSDGRLLLAHHVTRREMRGAAPGSDLEAELTWLDYGFPSDLSDDGRLVFFAENGEGGGRGYSVYLRSIDGAPAVRLGGGAAMAMSPDSKLVFANQDYTSEQQKWVLLPTGPGEPRTLDHGALRAQAATFAPDGSLLVVAGEGDGPARVYRLDPARGQPRALGPEGATFALPSRPVSPDSRSVVLRAADGSHAVHQLDGGAARPLATLTPDEQVIRWSHDGLALYCYRPGQVPAEVFRLSLGSGERSPWRKLQPPDLAGVVAVTPVLLSADGRGHVYGYRRVLSDLYAVEGLR